MALCFKETVLEMMTARYSQAALRRSGGVRLQQVPPRSGVPDSRAFSRPSIMLRAETEAMRHFVVPAAFNTRCRGFTMSGGNRKVYQKICCAESRPRPGHRSGIRSRSMPLPPCGPGAIFLQPVETIDDRIYRPGPLVSPPRFRRRDPTGRQTFPADAPHSSTVLRFGMPLVCRCPGHHSQGGR